LSEYWNPKLYVDNCVGELKETINHTVVYDVRTWEAFVVERRRLKGTFLENLELFHFPFDTQVTLMWIASKTVNVVYLMANVSICLLPETTGEQKFEEITSVA